MKLIAYSVGEPRPPIRPAPATRPWLDKLPAAFGYRCLPLNIGSSHGWEILCPAGFSAAWTGEDSLDAIRVRTEKEIGWKPASHFGSGILTLHTRYLFRTAPGYNLFVTGPTNARKHGIAPLTGVIETDWSPYTFTMNWAFTEPGEVRFEEGEPFCMLFPVPRGLVDAVEPEIRDIAADPETKRRYDTWNASREQFLRDLRAWKTEAVEEKWQKHYYRGVWPEGGPASPAHQIKLRVKPFVDRTGGIASIKRRAAPRIVVKRKGKATVK
jgi:hypothetical protein